VKGSQPLLSKIWEINAKSLEEKSRRVIARSTITFLLLKHLLKKQFLSIALSKRLVKPTSPAALDEGSSGGVHLEEVQTLWTGSLLELESTTIVLPPFVFERFPFVEMVFGGCEDIPTQR
jgi:hypothetical protein